MYGEDKKEETKRYVDVYDPMRSVQTPPRVSRQRIKADNGEGGVENVVGYKKTRKGMER